MGAQVAVNTNIKRFIIYLADGSQRGVCSPFTLTKMGKIVYDPTLSLRVVLSKFCQTRDLDLSQIVPRNVETGEAIALSTSLGDVAGGAVFLETTMDKGLCTFI